ncbi:MAG TPA: zf-HC2 domain-containing protein [Thermoanaerobaculia bacterium]|nr:zf-HC2 domain-containing protein [Thermoanaerobaculia bacterium]
MKMEILGGDHVRELLPWFLIDALEPAEAKRVAAHLEVCSGCRAEVEAERALRDALRAAATPRIAPHASSFVRLMEQVEAAERRRLGTRALRLGSVVRERVERWLTPRRLRIAALVVAHNVVLVLAVVGIMSSGGRGQPEAVPDAEQAPRFETRSSERPLGAHRLRIVFRDDVAIWEIVDLLREQRLELVSGPSQVGAFEVEAAVDAELAGVVEHLRRDPRVRLVAGWP